MSTVDGKFVNNKENKNYSRPDNIKIKEIDKAQNLIFSNQEQTNSSNQSNSHKLNPKKLIEHASFDHDFSEYNIRAHDVIPLYFLKNHTLDDGDEINLSSSLFPIISNITVKDKDSIEITRIHMYENYYNSPPYPSEKIIIKRNLEINGKETFVSFYEDKMKKEIRSLSQNGRYSIITKFKLFRNPTEMLFLQNACYYRNVLETYFFYKSIRKLKNYKQPFDINLMTFHEFIKNLF
jgi:hypothetical protein